MVDFDAERYQDEIDFAADATRELQRRAKENPDGWEAKFLEQNGGAMPVFHNPRTVARHEIEKRISAKAADEENQKILSRW